MYNKEAKMRSRLTSGLVLGASALAIIANLGASPVQADDITINMAVPDWPGTYGYNMFLYPLSSWYYGPLDLFLEHGHRLWGTWVGLLSIALFVTSFYTKSRQLRWVTGFAVLLVIAQGVLGGYRVELARRELAGIHGVIGPGYFAYTILLLVLSSKWWNMAGQRQWWVKDAKGQLSVDESRLLGSIWEKLWVARSVAVVTTVLAYIQLILGASVRHLPKMAMATTDQFRIVVWFHVLMAIAVAVAAILLVTRRTGPVPGLSRSRWFLVALVAVQLGLGFGTWVVKYGWPDFFDGVVYAELFQLQVKN